MNRKLIVAAFALALVAPLSSGGVAPLEAAQNRVAPAPPPAPPAPVPPAAPPAPAAPAPPPAPQAPAPPPAPQAPAARSNSNVQLDVVITDTISGKPEAKRVTMVLASGRPGSIRTMGMVSRGTERDFPVELALDGGVNILPGDLIETRVTFTYASPPPPGASPSTLDKATHAPSQVRENLTAVLRSGQPLLVSRSADPATDRTVTVELTATILEP